MGSCCCKQEAEYAYGRPRPRYTASLSGRRSAFERKTVVRIVDPNVVDQLLLELLSIMGSFVDTDEETPVPLLKLHLIADKEEGWFQVVSSLVYTIPFENPLGPSVITIVFDDSPLPSRDSVIKLTRLFGLCAERAKTVMDDLQTERNLCIVLGCIADKLVGPNSVAVLTRDTLEYMITYLVIRHNACLALFALIALEKFALATETKLLIKARLQKEDQNPLVTLERLADIDDYGWRQVGFCAKWSLDNIFVMEERTLSCDTVDVSSINAMLNTKDVSEYLKISCDGLEARCDSYSFESVRCTYQVDIGSWYYECLIITSGVMQIGWATKNSHFLNHEGFGIGDDIYSVAYDGCRRLLWHEAKPTPIYEVPSWKPGDIVGCLIDVGRNVVIFSLNGVRLKPCRAIFKSASQGFFAGASFMAFQQCRFNFGAEPFRYPPRDRKFSSFNKHGSLTDEEKRVAPRRLYMKELRNAPIVEGCCTLCCDLLGSCLLEPCMHKGFCSVCTSLLKECPICRATIMSIRQEI